MTLPQLANTVEIVGTLKEMNIESKVSVKGNKYVRGTVTVVSKADNKVHEHRIAVMVMETSKLIKGIRTMLAEYKSIEAVGEENADRIKVTGEIQLQEYYGKDDQLKSFNEIKGVFFNRLDADSDQPDKAVASIEVIVDAFVPVVDEPTGEIIHHQVNCYTIGYGEKVIEIKKAMVGEKLSNAMEDLYQPGSTGRLTFKINNYVEKTEKTEQEEPVAMSHGFGSEETVEGMKVFDKYVSSLEITGGDLPFEDEKALTEEQRQVAKRSLALAREELKTSKTNNAPSTPQQGAPTGFGGDVATQMPTGMSLPSIPSIPSVPVPTADVSTDDVPDF